MKRQDLIKTASVALGTAAITVATCWTGPVNAGNEGQALPAKIARPKLITHGVELTLVSTGDRAPATGDKPRFELTALNLSEAPVSLPVCVQINATSMPDALARVVRIPNLLWQQEFTLTLKPKETKVLPVQAAKALPASSMISVLLGEAGASATGSTLATSSGPVAQQRILMLSFSTAGAEKTPALAGLLLNAQPASVNSLPSGLGSR
jgi:hypothetical protein